MSTGSDDDNRIIELLPLWTEIQVPLGPFMDSSLLLSIIPLLEALIGNIG